MNRFLITGGLLLVLLILATGCSDDDCPACPTRAQRATALVEVQLREGMIYLSGTVRDLEAMLPDLDSVRVDGVPVEQTANLQDGGAYWYLRYNEPEMVVGKPASYETGDTVRVEFFTPTGTCYADVRLMDTDDVSLHIIGYEVTWPYDTVEVGSDVSVEWNTIEIADYYHVYLYGQFDSLGSTIYPKLGFVAADSSFTMPDKFVSYNGAVGIYVTAISGPDLYDGESNIVGSAVDGHVFNGATTYFALFVGTGDPWPTGSGGTDVEPLDLSQSWFEHLISTGL